MYMDACLGPIFLLSERRVERGSGNDLFIFGLERDHSHHRRGYSSRQDRTRGYSSRQDRTSGYRSMQTSRYCRIELEDVVEDRIEPEDIAADRQTDIT